MSRREWPANDYAIGSYIQATVAEEYLSYLKVNPTDKILDIGCGNGAFTKNILMKVPQGSVLGIDASENMLHLAQDVSKEYPNFSVQKADVLTMDFHLQFDYVVSFWCLQWACANIQKAFLNIVNALKPGGKFLTLFPAGDDPFIMSYYALKKSGQFASLHDFIPPVDYSHLNNLEKKLESLSCQELKVKLCRQSITLPSLDVFRKFVNGIAFYQGQLPNEEIQKINEAMVQYYDNECQAKYHGEYQFNFTIYLVTGEK
ncbi:TPA: methyltransferase domain-containing protein [Legionella pneumophila subsp. pneumophila]|uniref:class I SAM-dependent methyltransferase n=1 Tax=Legionella pneumophila TaxID=446 RepID=UPI0001E3C711|nr:class I SAM-dependent methyltransferase [Legionella pneumophila]MDW8880553.1 methyltransferase domain-containing protein [Legionella pneumophila subsp. fraseri]MDC8030248.1 class I SAM-dependent methyltransferase [Legionella pneumophila subsp. pneumophila]MDW8871240.1 methyltransferase domain-containing protein [Legionella pneumophila]MDW8917265.1 methyltransferase domain-containing protein [Legionella pneumophila]MDW8925820.1 methyltransferase domain-containing protein [Legionella pneumoph